MQVTVTRRGGLAGIALRGTVDTAEFAGAEEVLRGRIKVPPTNPVPDGFTYEVAFDGQTVTLTERDLSPGLQRLVDAAMAKGEIV